MPGKKEAIMDAHKSPGLFDTLRRLIKEIKPFKRKLVLSCILLLFSSAAGLGGSLLIGRYTDAVLSGQGERDVLLLILLAAAVVLAIAFNAANQFYWGSLNQQIAFELRKKTVQKINRVNFSWLESQTSGDLIVRLDDDLNKTLGYVSQFRNMGVSILMGLLSFLLTCYINPFLAIGYVLFPVLMQTIIYVSSKKMEGQFRKRQENMGNVSACSQEYLSGVAEIKAMNLEKAYIKRYLDRVVVFITHLITLDKAGSRNDTMLEALGYFQSVLILILGGFMVFWGKITIGELLIAQLLSANVGAAIQGLNFFQLRMNLVSALRVFELWDEKEAPGGGRILDGEGNALALRHIDFTYPQRPGVKVLKDINMSVKPRQKAAIVGPSGSGKSSIIKLIAGFYPPDSGSIALSRGESNYAMIEQDTMLFSDTFYNNIACGNRDFYSGANLEELVTESAKRASIHAFIAATDQGYNSSCTAYGANLSGGQRQRLSIARCLCRDADIILLDEPTSALDKENEAALMRNLTDVFKDKTVILITHNLKLVQDFDIIYLLLNGEIVASGGHGDLLKNELYCQLLQEDENGKNS
jgi:ABC-type multidrug transport system fused ATPase/permease subunit